MNTTTVGIDLAKNVFSICIQDAYGRVTARQDLRRSALAPWLAQLPVDTVVAMEACGGAHYWARLCQQQGLTVKMIAAQFVRPFRKNQCAKNDRNDAEAIATAARQGNMRFVTVKTVEQQARLALHSVREGYKKERTALINRLHGLLLEFGIVVTPAAAVLKRAIADYENDGRLPVI